MHRRVFVLTSLYDAFSYWFAAGALARVNVELARAIHEAVINENWRTARELLSTVMEGKLSGST